MDFQLTGILTDMGYLIQFPDNMEAEKLSGTLYVDNLYDSSLDFQQPLVLSGTNVLIPKKRIQKGPWKLTVKWAYDGVPYTTIKLIP